MGSLTTFPLLRLSLSRGKNEILTPRTPTTGILQINNEILTPRTPTTGILQINRNDINTSSPHSKTIEIPIESSIETPIPIVTVNKPPPTSTSESESVVKIQSAYRSYVVRTLIKKIASLEKEANRLESLIQMQETVDAIRKDEKEKFKMNEALMNLLLKLDSIPGVYESVRDVRRKVSRRIVELQEILDGLTDERVIDSDELMRNWEEMVAEVEEKMWEECRGDEVEKRVMEKKEMERFCVEKLGFRCFERFLRGV